MRKFAALLLVCILAACATPHRLSQPTPGYDTASPEKRHHTAMGFRNVGDFKPSVGADWRVLIGDPYSASVSVDDDHILSANRVRAGIKQSARSNFALTWIGHSTFLIRFGGKWILTDPFFDHRASPLRTIGPQRSVPAAIAVEDLPKIDVIVISHNHYDHLDASSLKKLARRNRDTAVFLPLKNGSVARHAGFHDVNELDWFETGKAGSLSLTATPAVHSSRRGLQPFNSALWSGWSIKAGDKKLYFAGDTGFGSFIKDIRRELGRHDVALVPIGAYEPPKLESARHTTPEEAVRLGEIVGARHIVPMHWGTIALTSESFQEQKRRYLKAAGRRANLMKIGETLVITR